MPRKQNSADLREGGQHIDGNGLQGQEQQQGSSFWRGVTNWLNSMSASRAFSGAVMVRRTASTSSRISKVRKAQHPERLAYAAAGAPLLFFASRYDRLPAAA